MTMGDVFAQLDKHHSSVAKENERLRTKLEYLRQWFIKNQPNGQMLFDNITEGWDCIYGSYISGNCRKTC